MNDDGGPAIQRVYILLVSHNKWLPDNRVKELFHSFWTHFFRAQRALDRPPMILHRAVHTASGPWTPWSSGPGFSHDYSFALVRERREWEGALIVAITPRRFVLLRQRNIYERIPTKAYYPAWHFLLLWKSTSCYNSASLYFIGTLWEAIYLLGIAKFQNTREI